MDTRFEVRTAAWLLDWSNDKRNKRNTKYVGQNNAGSRSDSSKGSSKTDGGENVVKRKFVKDQDRKTNGGDDNRKMPPRPLRHGTRNPYSIASRSRGAFEKFPRFIEKNYRPTAVGTLRLTRVFPKARVNDTRLTAVRIKRGRFFFYRFRAQRRVALFCRSDVLDSE